MKPTPERNRGAQDAYRKMRRYMRKQYAEAVVLSTDTLPSGRQKVNLLYTGRAGAFYEAIAEIEKEVKRAGNRIGGEGRK